jgi:hypothetical protein
MQRLHRRPNGIPVFITILFCLIAVQSTFGVEDEILYEYPSPDKKKKRKKIQIPGRIRFVAKGNFGIGKAGGAVEFDDYYIWNDMRPAMEYSLSNTYSAGVQFEFALQKNIVVGLSGFYLSWIHTDAAGKGYGRNNLADIDAMVKFKIPFTLWGSKKNEFYVAVPGGFSIHFFSQDWVEKGEEIEKGYGGNVWFITGGHIMVHKLIGVTPEIAYCMRGIKHTWIKKNESEEFIMNMRQVMLSLGVVVCLPDREKK